MANDAGVGISVLIGEEFTAIARREGRMSDIRGEKLELISENNLLFAHVGMS
jgi:hypothetical protein